MGYRERLTQVRTKSSDNWWPFTIGYPLAWRFVALTGDLRWITPNGLTIVSTLALWCGAGLLFVGSGAIDLVALVLLQVHVVLDCADGTLARYRRASTTFGAFLDKAGDQLGFLALGAAAGYRAYLGDDIGAGEPWIVLAGAVGAGFYVAVCYFYWVTAYFQLQAQTERTVVPGAEEHAAEAPSLGRRLATLVAGQWRFLHFNAPDFPLWVPLFVLLGRPDVVALAIFVTQGITVVRKLIERGLAAARLDRAS